MAPTPGGDRGPTLVGSLSSHHQVPTEPSAWKAGEFPRFPASVRVVPPEARPRGTSSEPVALPCAWGSGGVLILTVTSVSALTLSCKRGCLFSVSGFPGGIMGTAQSKFDPKIPLGCLLANFETLGFSRDLRKCHLIHYCTVAWPQYRLDSQSQWPLRVPLTTRSLGSEQPLSAPG